VPTDLDSTEIASASGAEIQAPAAGGRVNRYALFVLPALTLMAGIYVYPLWIVVEQSVHDDKGVLTIEGYRELLTGPLFFRVLWTSLEIDVMATAIALVAAYPIAYHLSRQTSRRRMVLSGLVLLPLWTSVLVKSLAFIVVFGDSGIVAAGLRWLGLEPPQMMFNRTGVLIGLVHYFIPFMAFPILSSLLQRDPSLEKAARIMGAGRLRIFWRIIVPLSMPGVLAGCLLSFILCLGFFVTPALLGSRKDVMLANLIDFYLRQTFDWTIAAAASVLLLMLSAVFIVLLARVPGGRKLVVEGV